MVAMCHQAATFSQRSACHTLNCLDIPMVSYGSRRWPGTMQLHHLLSRSMATQGGITGQEHPQCVVILYFSGLSSQMSPQKKKAVVTNQKNKMVINQAAGGLLGDNIQTNTNICSNTYKQIAFFVCFHCYLPILIARCIIANTLNDDHRRNTPLDKFGT